MIVRSFAKMVGGSEQGNHNPEPEKEKGKPVKGVPKEIGEYIDYEEVD